VVDPYRYSLRKLQPSLDDVVSLDQAKHNAALDGTEHDQAMVECLWQAREYIEQRTDCSLLATTWEITMDAFPKAKAIYLPRWPLQSIVEVNYVDTQGQSQAIPSEDLVLRLDDHGRGRFALRKWARWPAVDDTPDAVRVEFVAGWPSAVAVPPTFTRAMLMLSAWWFEQREAGIVGVSAIEAPLGIRELIDSMATSDDFGDFDLCDNSVG
jgi:uncharacterized phiE125 gp8 family phage protein